MTKRIIVMDLLSALLALALPADGGMITTEELNQQTVAGTPARLIC
jgi:hypothetical protein